MRFYFYKSEARRYVWHAGAAQCAVRVRRGVRGGRGAVCGVRVRRGVRSGAVCRVRVRRGVRSGAGVMAIIDGTIYESLKVFVGKRKRLAFKNGLHNLLNSI